MKLWNRILANIYCKKIDKRKMALLGAVGDMEIAYWQSDLMRWQNKFNKVIIHD